MLVRSMKLVESTCCAATGAVASSAMAQRTIPGRRLNRTAPIRELNIDILRVRQAVPPDFTRLILSVFRSIRQGPTPRAGGCAYATPWTTVALACPSRVTLSFRKIGLRGAVGSRTTFSRHAESGSR